MAKTAKKELDFSKWEQQKQLNTQEIQKLNQEEATSLGKIEQLQRRLKEIAKDREGLVYANVTGDNVTQLAVESFEELNKPEETKE